MVEFQTYGLEEGEPSSPLNGNALLVLGSRTEKILSGAIAPLRCGEHERFQGHGRGSRLTVGPLTRIMATIDNRIFSAREGLPYVECPKSEGRARYLGVRAFRMVQRFGGARTVCFNGGRFTGW